MTTYETKQVVGWIGQTAYDTNGDEIGRVETIYEDDDGAGPEWFAISTTGTGGHVSFAPVQGATFDGGRLRLRWDNGIIRDAPRCPADGHLSPEEEARLYEYYGMDRSSATTDTSTPSTGRTDSGDDAMTRSEEELDVDTRSREAGRARLRKWVETEQVNVTVPVRREVARLVTEPITDSNIGKAMDGPEITDNEYDVVLTEEEVVVDKKVVPKERVRLEKDVVEEQRQVTEEVRKERIGFEDDASNARK